LETVEDPEKNTAHLIGAILAGVALTALCCFMILCACRRRKKKKKEKEAMEEENMKVGNPIWMNVASSDS